MLEFNYSCDCPPSDLAAIYEGGLINSADGTNVQHSQYKLEGTIYHDINNIKATLLVFDNTTKKYELIKKYDTRFHIFIRDHNSEYGYLFNQTNVWKIIGFLFDDQGFVYIDLQRVK